MRGLYYRSTPLEKPWESVSIDTAHGRYAKLGELLGAIQTFLTPSGKLRGGGTTWHQENTF